MSSLSPPEAAVDACGGRLPRPARVIALIGGDSPNCISYATSLARRRTIYQVSVRWSRSPSGAPGGACLNTHDWEKRPYILTWPFEPVLVPIACAAKVEKVSQSN